MIRCHRCGRDGLESVRLGWCVRCLARRHLRRGERRMSGRDQSLVPAIEELHGEELERLRELRRWAADGLTARQILAKIKAVDKTK
jgi:hypothetical protein